MLFNAQFRAYRGALWGAILALAGLVFSPPAAAQSSNSCTGSITNWIPTNLRATQTATDIANGTVTLSWDLPCTNLHPTGIITMVAYSDHVSIDYSVPSVVDGEVVPNGLSGELWGIQTTTTATDPLPSSATISSGTLPVIGFVNGKAVVVEFPPQPLPAGTQRLKVGLSDGVHGTATPAQQSQWSNPITIASPLAGVTTQFNYEQGQDIGSVNLPAVTLGDGAGCEYSLTETDSAALPSDLLGLTYTAGSAGTPPTLSGTADRIGSVTLKYSVANCTAPRTPASVELTLAVTEITPPGDDRTPPSETPSDTNQQNTPPQNTANTGGTPPAESSSSSGGIVALALVGAGGYYYWKKRQIASGNAAKMALLPDVSFDLDRRDNRAFYTRMNWANSSGSNWQIRSNATVHTKYSGKLLDWNADSHLGYRLNGKFGDFNPYAKAKFVQNDPENAKMEETYTFGVNYVIPERFSVQFLQPDDQIWRYSLKTEMRLPKNISLQLNQPNSDIWRYSANLNWQISERIGLNLSQPSSDLPNYGFGIQWRNKSKIRYGLHGETGSNSYRFSGEFWF